MIALRNEYTKGTELLYLYFQFELYEVLTSFISNQEVNMVQPLS